MATRIVLLGAGSAMFGLGSLGNILKSRVLQGCTVVLHDINSAALERVERVARRHMLERNLPHTLVVTTSREDARFDAEVRPWGFEDSACKERIVLSVRSAARNPFRLKAGGACGEFAVRRHT